MGTRYGIAPMLTTLKRCGLIVILLLATIGGLDAASSFAELIERTKAGLTVYNKRAAVVKIFSKSDHSGSSAAHRVISDLVQQGVVTKQDGHAIHLLLRKNSENLTEAEMLETWDNVVDKLYKGLGEPQGVRRADINTSLMYFTGLRAANIWNLNKSGAIDGELLSRATQGFFLAARAGADYRGLRNIIKSMGKFDAGKVDNQRPRLVLEFLDDLGVLFKKDATFRNGDDALRLTSDEKWLNGARGMMRKLMRAQPFEKGRPDAQWMRAFMEVRVASDVLRYIKANPGSTVKVDFLAPTLSRRIPFLQTNIGAEGIDLVIRLSDDVDDVFALELKNWDLSSAKTDLLRIRVDEVVFQSRKHGAQLQDIATGTMPQRPSQVNARPVLFVVMGRQRDTPFKYGEEMLPGTFEEHVLDELGASAGLTADNFFYMGARTGAVGQVMDETLGGHLDVPALLERLSSLPKKP